MKGEEKPQEKRLFEKKQPQLGAKLIPTGHRDVGDSSLLLKKQPRLRLKPKEVESGPPSMSVEAVELPASPVLTYREPAFFEE
jgi:hypothetical protein